MKEAVAIRVKAKAFMVWVEDPDKVWPTVFKTRLNLYPPESWSCVSLLSKTISGWHVPKDFGSLLRNLLGKSKNIMLIIPEA